MLFPNVLVYAVEAAAEGQQSRTGPSRARLEQSALCQLP